MQLHELKIKHEYLVDVTTGRKTFELRKNDRNYQVGDLIRFIDLKYQDEFINDKRYKCINDVNIDPDTLYKITYILKDVPEYGLDKDHCILGIKKLNIRE